MDLRIRLPVLILLALLACLPAHAEEAGPPAWVQVEEVPEATRPTGPGGQRERFRLNRGALESRLAKAPREFTPGAADQSVLIELPMPDGSLKAFRVLESPVLPAELGERYRIRTYAARGVDDPAAVARFSLGPSGLEALVLAPSGEFVIRPDRDGPDQYVSVPYSEDRPASKVGCGTTQSDLPSFKTPGEGPQALTNTGWSNDVLIYHLAVAASGEFTQANGMTTAAAMEAITNLVNGVNAIFRRDVAIHFELAANNDLVVYTDPNNDPYTAGDRDCTLADCFNMDCVLTQNQCVLDAFLGHANYDIGIVLDGYGGGKAQGGVCGSGKGRSAAETDISVIAHELGHMIGATHTYNDGSTGDCSLERIATSAWEPGSGSTVMSYASLCGAANLISTRGLDFHHGSATQIREAAEDWGYSCAGHGLTANYPPVVLGITPTVTVPVLTPFVLDVQAYDSNGDTVTYSWEQFDLGAASPPEEDDGTRPIFRAYPPTTTSSRYFPSYQYVDLWDNEPPETTGCVSGIGDCQTGESLPETSRTLHFRVMLRDQEDGVTIAETIVNTDAGSGPFEVTQPTDATDWTEGTKKTITWNTANTQNPPVNCQSVRILYSDDGGDTWPVVLAASTPNDGSELVTLPFGFTPFARIKIEAIGNVFYDISETFTIRDLAVRNTQDSGPWSLRQAILDVNDYPTGATIPISIPGTGVRTISLNSMLPAITKPVILDAWELGGPGYTGPPLLELAGGGCPEVTPGVPCDGLVIQADNSNINGFIVRNFGGNGIVLRGAGAYATAVQNSYIGTNATGTAAAGNGRSGILIDGGYGNPLYGNLIGQNVISGNQVGVTITGASASGNALIGNRIGTTADGTARLPNLDDGVRIVGAPNTRVGQPGSGNLISGNGTVLNGFVNRYADAIDVSGATATGTIIQGNTIGLDVTGTTGIYNTAGEITVTNAPNTLIGGTVAGARNVVGDDGSVNFHSAHCILVQGAGATGTVIQGNYLGTDATGTLDRGCRGAGVYLDGAPGVQIGGTTAAARNVISGNNDYGGVWVTNNATGTTIQGNYIGVDATGMVAVPNNPFGVELTTSGNTIGGTAAGAGNVISGNTQQGIDLDENGAFNNVIQGNFIGTNAAGTAAIGNGGRGISLERSPNNLIGGTTAAARNVISGNGGHGIYISGSFGLTAPGNLVQGNYIGTDATGSAAIGNAVGIELYYVSDVTIGGSAPGAGNVIAASRGGDGVRVYSFGQDTSGIVVQGNRIGTNAAGTAALGNVGEGIWGAITGTASILGNVIAASGLNGVSLLQGSFTVQGNWIGTDVTGTLNLRNTWSGVYSSSPAACLIGGTGPGEGNTIAFNAPSNTGVNHAGVQIAGAAAGQTVRGNRIYSNTGLGIDLHFLGANANDACDPDNGPNRLQNFPVLSATNQSGSSTRVTGTLNSTAGTSFTVDFYASPSCDALGYGEGATWIGSTSVPTDGSCNGAFDLLLPVPSSGVVTATATDPLGNTSEFSACRTIAPSPVAEVPGFLWTSTSELIWDAAAGATGYRLLRGETSAIPDLLDADLDSCTRFSGASLGTGPIVTEIPSSGTRIYWYLVVGSNGADDGPFGSGAYGAHIANESGICP